MEQSFFNLIYFLHCPGLAEIFLDILLSSVPIWLAVMIGLVIGWSWRPRWTGLLYLGLCSKLRFAWTAPPGGLEVLACLHGIFGWSETLVQVHLEGKGRFSSHDGTAGRKWR
ncbi:hypothetical protein LOK49_LG04G02729 [Camellia lanceoleosa]|uniref:Uncharacterized protein n=1 Tax=Camellia lanceoleosa TaxID=1840588 RepID=A0ACC0I1V3_9ERIC|nr:hypothetical protein LOK49_LG04G02729 [Camellia lanceoleosa]